MTGAFSMPAWQRLLVAIGYAGAVAAAVWTVDGRDRPATPPEPAMRMPGTAMLVAEATFPVGRWMVLVDGREVSGQAGDLRWEGTVTGHEVLVQAERRDAADLSPGAVRLTIAGHASIAWGDGPVSAGAAIP